VNDVAHINTNTIFAWLSDAWSPSSCRSLSLLLHLAGTLRGLRRSDAFVARPTQQAQVIVTTLPTSFVYGRNMINLPSIAFTHPFFEPMSGTQLL
jgi:hypothetical protein